MKNIYLKTALFADQIKAINALKGEIAGVEVQLLKPTDNLDMLFEIEVPVLSIHYYLSKEEDIDGWYNCDSDIELITHDLIRLEQFDKVCSYAHHLSCSVGIHLNSSIIRMNYDGIKAFVEISKKYPDVLIYLENIGLKRKSGYVSNLEDLYEAVKVLKAMGANVDMLVDTCHAKIASKLRCLDHEREIVRYIDTAEASAKRVYLHLADATKDGAGENHGTNFLDPEDLSYLNTILNRVNACRKDVDIVLEVNDKDLIAKPKAMALKAYVGGKLFCSKPLFTRQ